MPGPEMIHCHEEIAYHFSRDSLVFVPSEKALPWLPANYVFSPGGTSLPPAMNGGVGMATAYTRPDGSPMTSDEHSLAA